MIPALGVTLSAHGPLTRRILATITRSPRSVALASGPAPSIPPGWHTVAVGAVPGLTLDVPQTWPVARTEGQSKCGGPTPIARFVRPAVTLSSDNYPFSKQCWHLPVQPTSGVPHDGVRVDSGIFARPGVVPASRYCLHPGKLTVCAAAGPLYSVLVVYVTGPHIFRPIIVSIGLAGNGMTARRILYSLRVV
jgi:hypothetical protein